MDTACEKPAGVGSEEQKLPTVTLAGMPSLSRALCRVPGSNSSPGLSVSVAVPLALLTSVNAAVWIVPARCAGAEPIAPDRPRPRTKAAAAAAAVMLAASRQFPRLG